MLKPLFGDTSKPHVLYRPTVASKFFEAVEAIEVADWKFTDC
ncbi:MAG: hypothetical protein AB3N21_06645 [Ruegeria sp.]